MIKIEPQNIANTYSKIKDKGKKKNEINSDEYDAHTSLGSFFNLITGISTETDIMRIIDYIPFLPPFENISSILFSDGESYSGRFFYKLPFEYHFSLNRGGLEEKQTEIKRLIKRSRRNLLRNKRKKIDLANGLIFLGGPNGDEPYFLLDYEDFHDSTALYFGEKGTKARKLTSLEQFETDISDFCDIATEVANSFYTKTPDLKLYLSI
jgi:hypothetical protein